MRIGIDIRPLQTESGQRGVGVYVRELVRSLLRIKSKAEFIFLASSRKASEDLSGELKERTIFLKRPIKNIVVWDQIFSYGIIRKLKLDIYHSPFYALPLAVPRSVSVVQTIHDLTPLLFKESVSVKNRGVFRINFHLSRYADRIIAVSKNTKDDIVKLLKIPSEKIVVVHNGADHLLHSSRGDATRCAGDFEKRKPYLLYVGGFDPMKNIPVLIEAFDRVCATKKNLKLLLVGADSAALRNEKNKILFRKAFSSKATLSRIAERLLSEGKIVLGGFLKQDALLSCYRKAEIFVFPSLYEGFGFPPLEAMQCGLPVLASKSGSLPEVLGDAAVYFDPRNVDDLATKIETILNNEDMKARMRKAGIERASKFLWEEAAQKTFQIYRTLHEEKEKLRTHI